MRSYISSPITMVDTLLTQVDLINFSAGTLTRAQSDSIDQLQGENDVPKNLRTVALYAGNSGRMYMTCIHAYPVCALQWRIA